jgi:hypothetical protein
MLATEPGQSATVLLALAILAGIPTNMSAGKVKKLPPPATELSVPPTTARRKSINICGNVTG